MENATGLIHEETLNGHNYFSWSQSIKMVFEGYHKYGNLTGGILKPSSRDPHNCIRKKEDFLLRLQLIIVVCFVIT